MQMQALLVKNDEWSYVNGEYKNPDLVEGDPNSAKAVAEWVKMDSKARSGIILCIAPTELKQIKSCTTSRELWVKLENIYQSKGPARKATFLKQLTLQRLNEGGDIRDHINKFFDAVDKLREMDMDINSDLLAIMLLYSLPKSFENFGCAIESRDQLPSPEVLRLKITEESDARKSDTRNVISANHNAMLTRGRPKFHSNAGNGVSKFKFKCYKCGIVRHKAIDCRSKSSKRTQEVKAAKNDNFDFCASETMAD